MAAFADTMCQATENDFVLNLPIFHTTGDTVEHPDRTLTAPDCSHWPYEKQTKWQIFWHVTRPA